MRDVAFKISKPKSVKIIKEVNKCTPVKGKEMKLDK